MRTLKPTLGNDKFASNVRKVNQSIYKALAAGQSNASPIGMDSAGVFNKFVPDNGSGVMIRIGATGSGETYTWPANDTGVVIHHGLGRQPIGFQVHDVDGPAHIYRTTTPDTSQITLASSDATKSVTVYIT